MLLDNKKGRIYAAYGVSQTPINKNIQRGESKKQYATRILNEKYGKGNWGKGPRSEYSRIIKYHRK